MLGLGSTLTKVGKIGLPIVTDNLVLQHKYIGGKVHQVSTGAADINADSAGSEHINVGAITIGTGDVSVSAWVYVTSFVNYGGIFTNREDGGSHPGIEIRTRTGTTRVEILIDDGGSSTSSISGDLDTRRWYHICAVWDRSDKQFLYIDGVLVDSDSITSENVTCNHSDSALIGKRTYDSGSTVTYFKGYICNVGYWNRVLSQAEVKSIWYKKYADLTTAEKTSLVSWWNLDSTIDSTQLSYDGSTTVGAGNTTVYDNHHGAGDTLGSELITGGDFGGAGANWSTAAGWDDTGGFGAWTSGDASSSNRVYQDISALVVGKTYKVMFTISNNTTGRQLVRLDIDGSGGTNQDVTYLNDGSTAGYGTHANGTHTFYFTATHAHDQFSFYGNKTYGDFRVDDISLKLVNGNTGTLS